MCIHVSVCGRFDSAVSLSVYRVNACVVHNNKSQTGTDINASSSQFFYSASKTIYKNHILSKHIQSVIANIN